MLISSPLNSSTGFNRPASNPKQPATPQTTLHFGRDALFERNDRYYSEESSPSSSWHFRRSHAKPKTLAEVRQASEPLYDNTQGRIKGKSVIQKAVQLAEKEVELTNSDPQSSLIDKNLAKVKLANALIAEDRDSERGETLLADALDELDKAGFNPKWGEAPPIYIHGLYNRGAGYFNNRIYKETRKNTGDEEMDLVDADNEGIWLDLRDETDTEQTAECLKQDMRYLNKAITLSSGLQDKKLAEMEYLSAKGEIHHVLSHLSNDTMGRQHDVEGLNIFHSALAKLNSLPKMLYTPRHFKLAEVLGQIKIPHMCEHQHRPAGADSQCKSLSQGSELLLKIMLAQGVLPPELTDAEMDSTNIMENRFKLNIPIR